MALARISSADSSATPLGVGAAWLTPPLVEVDPQPATATTTSAADSAAARLRAIRIGVPLDRPTPRAPDPSGRVAADDAPSRSRLARLRRGSLRRVTATTTRVFVARLAGTAVFDPNGDQVGKVRDVVVLLRHGNQPPRGLGLVVEVQGRRRVFVPMTRITSMDAGQVVTTGLINLRRFEQRIGESLVVGELLDRKVDLLGTDERVTVLDVGLDQDPRTRDWTVSRIFVRRGGGGLRRRGETSVVAWNAVAGLSLTASDQGAEAILRTIGNMRPADVANVLQDLPARRLVEVARELDDGRLADVLEELPDDDRVQVVAALEAGRAADVLQEMDPDDAADLLGELPPETAAAYLALMEPDDAADLRRLLAYDDYTAGGMMTTEPVVLAPDATVADALARVRQSDLSPSLAAQVYVTRPPMETPTGKYLGVAHFQRLLREPPATLVTAVIDSDLEPIGPDAPLAQVARYFATYNLVAIPVVDEGDHLLGAVTVDDVVDHMLPDNWRDLDDEEPVDDEEPDEEPDDEQPDDDEPDDDEPDRAGGRDG